MSSPYDYVGDELTLFEKADRWKRYFGSELRPFLKGRVLEAGAGIGGTTAYLGSPLITSYCLLEPDASMLPVLREKAATLPVPATVLGGTINDLPASELFDTILYIDVLEHIEDDRSEVAAAAQHLAPGGHLLVLSPALPRLYSAFDKEIGHFRRYTSASLAALTPPELTLLHTRYLDSTGALASLANRLVLRQSYPTQQQVLFWDRWLVPVSRLTDRLFFHSFGKSIIAIWQKSGRV